MRQIDNGSGAEAMVLFFFISKLGHLTYHKIKKIKNKM